ncbi:MAG: twin-arginine translocation signal domain-containing protein [Verrucomicrobia bacterium]|nr:MAG: twin-arginine translocation signal domain-containing protein [Verrucomicrobiota bacterium]
MNMKPANRRDFLKLISASVAGAAVFPRLGKSAEAVFQGLEKQRPNVLFILADDLGWMDLKCQGSTFYETPNLDRLAERSLRLTQAYAANPLCSPTRSSIQTGLYPARTGVTLPACHLAEVRLEKRLMRADPHQRVIAAESLTRLKMEYRTLAQEFHDADYVTAHFGKWHLGFNEAQTDRYEPKDRGFDFEFPHAPNVPSPVGSYFAPWKFIKAPPSDMQPGEHIEDRMSTEAAKFIRGHKDKTFYINYCAYSVHAPWNAKLDYIEYFKAKADAQNPQHNPLYAAMIKSLDEGVGRLLAAVDESGIAERTIIVFFSDNGGYAYLPKKTDPAGYENIPATSNLPLRSGKASIYEGGTREPCLVCWPGKTKAGVTSDILFQSLDFYPTLLAMCGLSPRAGLKLDGVNQMSALLGQGAVRDRIFCHFPHGTHQAAEHMPGLLPSTYVRKGDWKLIRFYADNDDGSDRFELYNLQADLGETKNLTAEKPELVRELNELISSFLKDTEAVVPQLNPHYNPNAKPASQPRKRRAPQNSVTWRQQFDGASEAELGG